MKLSQLPGARWFFRKFGRYEVRTNPGEHPVSRFASKRAAYSHAIHRLNDKRTFQRSLVLYDRCLRTYCSWT